MDEENKGKIDRLDDVLYSRTRYKDPLDKRPDIKHSEGLDVEEKWTSPELDEMLRYDRPLVKTSTFMKKFFIFSLIFFLIALGVAAFVFIGGTSFVSSRNVNIIVSGPTIISAGEVLELGVSVSNTNNADLELASLSIQYPQGSRHAENTNEVLTFTKEDLGVIKAGSETTRNVRLVLLGPIGEEKEIRFSVEYKVKGSNATFYKDKISVVTIGSTPITLTVNSPNSVISGELFTTDISVTLNAPDILRNVILRAEYPHGYSASDSTPTPAADDNVWVLGDLAPGSKKTISLRGRLIGENDEERTFRFYVGVPDSLGGNNLRIVMVSLANTVAIDRPPVNLSVSLNGDNSSVYVAPAGRAINTVVRFRNNLPDKLMNPRLEVSLSGASLDKFSISASNNGFYDSANSKIVWSLANSSGLSELSPGESGQVNFSFSSLSGGALRESGVNDIALRFSITGTPVGQRVLTTVEQRTVRISSQVSFSSKALYSIGPFLNRGPIPPKAEEETTYTIVFSAGNTRGDLNEASATARLGQGVRWLGAYSAESESVSYDEASNTITWDLGTLASDTGFSSIPREAIFQVSLTPSISQIGSVPVLVTSITLSGRDSVGGGLVTVNASPLTTRLTSDPSFIQGDDVVGR